MRSKLIVFLLALSVFPMAVHAQFDNGAKAVIKKAWEQFPLNSHTRIRLDFKNANIDMVISLLSKTSGITIVKDPNLSQPVTVMSAGAVPLNEAFSIFNTVLNFRNYEMVKQGNLIIIRQKQPAPQPQINFNPNQFNQDNPVLKIYEVKYANAADVSREINDVFANQFARQNNGFGFIIGGFGDQQQAQRRGPPQVRASSDDYSNSVIVNAAPADQTQVEAFIKSVDKPADDPQKTEVYHLTYAAAEDLLTVVQNVLVQNAPRGRGGQGNDSVPFEQRFQQAARLGGTQAAFGTVTADDRTNSLVITATDDNHKIIAKLLTDLDKPTEYASSTIVIPLANARADQMANVLNAAFNSQALSRLSQLNNNTTLSRFNTANQAAPNPFGNNTSGGTSTGAGGRAVKELPLDLANPAEGQGELKTDVSTNDLYAQFFGGQFGGFGGGGGGRGGGGRGNQGRGGTGSNTPTVSHDAQGRVVNTKDLTSNVTVIPDMNTNSIIVVASPDDAETVREIVLQLDRIPDQVMIETIIVEATLGAEDKLGVEWKFNNQPLLGNHSVSGQGDTNFGQQTSTTPLQGLRYTITGKAFSAFVNALQTDSKFNVLSTPRIFTANNNEAQINISQRIPYVVSSTQSDTGTISFNYQFTDVGIVLTVTPRISANGSVTMDITQTANDLQSFTSFNAPIINQRIAQTTVSVNDGETIILGGIIRNTVTTTVSKVPLLGDVPILGNLFKSTDRTKNRTELLVFMTPHIVRSPDEARKLREEQQKQLNPASRKDIENAIGKGADGGGDTGKGGGGTSGGGSTGGGAGGN